MPILDVATVATIAVLLGAISRILYPYWRKITDTAADQPKPTFNWIFAITGLEAAIEGIIITAQILPAFLVSLSEPSSLLIVFVLGFNYAWGRTDLNNRIVT